MIVSVILGHPEGPSLNHSIADTVYQTLADNGHKILYHDLYEEGFNPVMTEAETLGHQSDDPLVQQYSDELTQSDGIVVIHPVWWGGLPAILKGWVDRAFTMGKAYNFETSETGEAEIVGLLETKSVLIFNTEGGKSSDMSPAAEPLEILWRDYIFGTCGVENIERKVFDGVMAITDEQRQCWLEEARSAVSRMFPKA